MSAEGDAPEAGAPEIEVTSLMIEAGLTEFLLFEPRTECVEDVVRQIYLAMERSRLISDRSLRS
jgi:hypothetical protein